MTMAKTNFKSQKDVLTQIEGHRVDNIHFGIICGIMRHQL